jgi:hypothetical protein
MTTPQGAFTTDYDGMDGIDPPVDMPIPDPGFSGLMVDRIDPTAQSLGTAFEQSAQAIAQVTSPVPHTGGVAPGGRVDNAS